MSVPVSKAQDIKRDDNTKTENEAETDKPIELEVRGTISEGEQPPVGIPKEYSGWDVYNNEARKVDMELVNDWRDSLNSLLLFVSSFRMIYDAFPRVSYPYRLPSLPLF